MGAASGCGKTTLLRLIGGHCVFRAPGGPIRVFGEALHELDHDGLYRLRRRAQMGMLVPVPARCFTDISVFENVAFRAARAHCTLPEELIRDLVLLEAACR